MRVLDLFSGLGGFSIGLERAGMETVAFCEYDKKAQLVLKKHWPEIPIYEDVRMLTGKQIREEIGTIDLICGGFPCQGFSLAGNRRGIKDDRYLWPEYFRIIKEVGPRIIVGENVNGIIDLALDQVLSDLESEGYSWQTVIIPACAVNAPHRRDRVWIIAYSRSHTRDNGYSVRPESQKVQEKRFDGICKNVAYTNEDRLQRESRAHKNQGKNESFSRQAFAGGSYGENVVSDSNRASTTRHGEYDRESQVRQPEVLACGCSPENWWAVEPELGRVADGIPNRMDRLKQLGNAVVPQVVEVIGRAIMKIERKSYVGAQ